MAGCQALLECCKEGIAVGNGLYSSPKKTSKECKVPVQARGEPSVSLGRAPRPEWLAMGRPLITSI